MWLGGTPVTLLLFVMEHKVPETQRIGNQGTGFGVCLKDSCVQLHTPVCGNVISQVVDRCVKDVLP